MDMKVTGKVSIKWSWILLGIMLGIECLGSKRNLIDVQMSKVKVAAVGYRVREGYFPSSLDMLVQSSYRDLNKEDLRDPWGEPFGYEYEGDNFVIWSSGPDKKIGTADDVCVGSPPSYVESWRAKLKQSIEEQKTNAVQGAMTGAIQPPTGAKKGTPGHIPVTGSQPLDTPAEPSPTKNTSRKMPLLIGVVIIGAITAWRYFRKKGTLT